MKKYMYSCTSDLLGDRAVVVMMHHPVLSAAKGRANPAIYSTFRYALSQADLVIAGHDHFYARRTPFVMLNTAGKAKKQKTKLHAEVCDSVAVYGVLSIQPSAISDQPSVFSIHRMSDGVAIDTIYVKHD